MYQVTKSDINKVSQKVTAVIDLRKSNEKDVRKLVLSQVNKTGPIMSLAKEIKTIRDNFGKANITPTVKAELTLDRLNAEEWAMLKLLGNDDDHTKFIIDMIKSNKPTDSDGEKIAVCMSVGLAPLYNWTKKACRSNGKTVTGNKPNSGNGGNRGNGGNGSNGGNDQVEIKPLTEDEIVALVQTAISKTDKKVVLVALERITRLIQNENNPLGLPDSKVV
jgi:hypothetical protein